MEEKSKTGKEDTCLCTSRRTFPLEVDPSDLSGQRLEDDHDGQRRILDVCAAKEKVKVSLGKALAERLGLQQEWILGRILASQREGAAQWAEEEPD